MTQKVADLIIDLVRKNLPHVSSLRVVWYGGEPLLGLKWIRYLSPQFRNYCGRLRRKYEASIVTNGYLLTPDISRELTRKHSVTNVQITIDGPPETHNRRRFLRTAPRSGTYETVVNNAANAAHYFGTVLVRINVDPTNAGLQWFKPVVDDVRARAGKFAPSIQFYLGYTRVSPTEQMLCRQMAKSAFSRLQRQLDYITGLAPRQLSVREISSLLRLRLPKSGICGAANALAYVIGPKGDLYKCWNHVLNPSEAFGRLSEPINPCHPNLTKWLGLDFFGNQECVNCTFFPLCLGGCPDDFSVNKNRTLRQHQTCAIDSAEEEFSLAAWIAFKEYFGKAPGSVVLVKPRLSDRDEFSRPLRSHLHRPRSTMGARRAVKPTRER